MFSGEFFDKWYSNYAKLEAFVKQQEGTTVTLNDQLGKWLEIQQRSRHMLPEELKEKLRALNLVIADTSHSWEARYKQLALFVQATGHATLPDDEQHEQLKDWLIRQIINKRLLSENQFQLLDKLVVDWFMPISRDQRWEQMYEKLCDFNQTFGHCRVPQGWQNDRQLALWVIVQRRKRAQGKLRQDRERRLNALNFTWSIQDVYDAQWKKFFQQLVSFHRKNGHCWVPGSYEKLVSWIERQRLSWKKGQLPQDRVKRLEEIGFIWTCADLKRRSWEANYRQLREYKKQHGHSFVPANCKENRSLGIWVVAQRGLEAKGKLPAARKKKLDQLEFGWSKETQHKLQSGYNAQWNANFEKLKAYRQEYGTCQVSLKIDPVLQRWTSWQRKLYYQGRLSQERIDRLNEIRFYWNVQEGYWLKMYEALVHFKTEFGHTQVPFQWESNPQLSDWVYRIRVNKQKLSTQKVALLDQIGFEWSIKRKRVTAWKSMDNRL